MKKKKREFEFIGKIKVSFTDKGMTLLIQQGIPFEPKKKRSKK